MIGAQNYEEAVHLLEITQAIPVVEKEEKLLNIRKMLAFHYFNNCQFETAMGLFQKLQISPILIIALFPTLLTSEIQATLDYPIPVISPSNFVSLILDSANLFSALNSLTTFLTSWRNKLNKFSESTKELDAELSVKKKNATVMQIPLQNVKQIVDTCLLKTFLATNESLVGSLVRVANHCNIEETEQLLIEFRKFQELLDFYYSKQLHFKALSLLKK